MNSIRKEKKILVVDDELDIRMPGMNGFELHEEMRKIDPEVLVCFITAGELYYDEVRGNGKEKKEEGQYCKLDGKRFLQKPISNVDLVKRIEKIIPQQIRIFIKTVVIIFFE